MSNYSQIVMYGPKDSLTLGDANKYIKGVQFDGEFQAISTAIASKIDSTFSNPSVLGINVTGATVPTNGIYLSSTNTVGLSAGGGLVLAAAQGTGATFAAPTSTNPSITANGPVVSIAGAVTGFNSGTAKTLFSLLNITGQQTVYLVAVCMDTSEDALHYSWSGIIHANTATTNIFPLNTSADLSVSLSGLNVQATQSSGNNNVTLRYSYLRLM